MSIIFAGADDQYFLEVCEGLLKKSFLKTIITHFPDRMDSELDPEIVDAKLFYRLEAVERAHYLFAAEPEFCSELNELFFDFIQSGQQIEIEFYLMMDRLDALKSSAFFRQRYYHALTRYFLVFLKKRSAQQVIFPSTPHMGWDFLLFHVAKFLGIETIIISRTLMNDRIFLIKNSIQSLNTKDLSHLKSLSDIHLLEKIDPEFLALVNGPCYWMEHSQGINKSVIKHAKKTFMKGKLRFAFFTAKRLLMGLHRLVVGEKEFKSAFAIDSRMSRIAEFLKIYLSFSYKNLQNYYAARSQSADFSKKFIYFPLHYQPERTTSPEGGIYVNQLLALQALAVQLPPGIELYVKEHPRQFTGRINSMFARDRHFYDFISLLPRTRLIALEENSEVLIAHASAIATVTGSAGWQGLMQGKPCISFGEPWFSRCEANFRVQSPQAVDQALGAALALSPERVQRLVNEFLVAYGGEFLIATNSEQFLRKSKMSRSELTRNLILFLEQAFGSSMKVQ